MKRLGQRCISGILVFVFLSAASLWAGEKVRVIVEKADVKLGKQVITTLEKGAELDVVTRKGDWVGVKVTVEGAVKTGWVLGADVETVAQAEAAPAAASGPAMQVMMDIGAGPASVGIPELVAFIRFRSVSDVTGKAQQMLMQINPMLGGMVSADFLGQKVGNPGLKGVDRKRPVAIVILNPKKYLNPAVGVIPTSDFSAIPKGQGEGGIQWAQAGTYALVGRDANAVVALSAALGGLRGIPLEGMNGEVEARLDWARILELLKPEMEMGLRALRNQAASGQAMAGSNVDPQAAMAMLDAQFRILSDFMQQIQEQTISVGMSADGLRIRTSIGAKEGTVLAQCMSSLPAPKHALAGLLPAGDSLMNLSMEIGSMAVWAESLLGVYRQALEGAKLPAADVDQAVQAAKTVIQALDGNGAMSLSMGSEGMSMVYCLGYSGRAEYLEAYRQGMKFWTQSSSQMGMQVQTDFMPAARVQGEVEVDLYTMIFQMGQQNQQQQIAAQFLHTLYGGDTLIEEITCLDKVIVITAGKEAAKSTDWMIEQVKKGGGQPPEDLKVVQGLFEGGGHLYGSLSLKKLVSVIEQVAAQFNPAFAGGGETTVEIPGPPVALYGKGEGSRATLELYIPTKPIAVIQAYFMQKMMQMQKPGGEGGAEEAPPGTF
ncbi:MAG: hypothetical protein HYU36_14940 [Planctomycetes bacterium]|nr:hypothetical protein [Planctomycetota bacterium]